MTKHSETEGGKMGAVDMLAELWVLCDNLTDVELAIDKQTYDACRKADFDTPDDYEFCINLEAKHKRVITKAVNGLTRCAYEIERLRSVLDKYAGQYCEGWCKENGGCFDDCGGCIARKALETP